MRPIFMRLDALPEGRLMDLFNIYAKAAIRDDRNPNGKKHQSPTQPHYDHWGYVIYMEQLQNEPINAIEQELATIASHLQKTCNPIGQKPHSRTDEQNSVVDKAKEFNYPIMFLKKAHNWTTKPPRPLGLVISAADAKRIIPDLFSVDESSTREAKESILNLCFGNVEEGIAVLGQSFLQTELTLPTQDDSSHAGCSWAKLLED